jgi:hypothetical protein
MKIEEATKIIAEFMGGPYIGDGCQNANPMFSGSGEFCAEKYVCIYCRNIPKHYLSLDNLIPVWEKLGCLGITADLVVTGSEEKTLSVYTPSQNGGRGSTIQVAAAIATAIAIQVARYSLTRSVFGSDRDN